MQGREFLLSYRLPTLTLLLVDIQGAKNYLIQAHGYT